MTTKLFQKILIALYLVSALWWLSIFVRGIKETTENYLFGMPMFFIPMSGGLYVLYVLCKNKKKYDLAICKAFFFLAIGLIAWGFGGVVFLYYNLVFNVPVPYPSLADIFYVFAVILWTMGLIYFAGTIHKKKFFLKALLRLSVCILALVIITVCFNALLSNVFVLPHINTVYVGFDFVTIFLVSFFIYYFSLYKEHSFLKKGIVLFLGFILNYLADFFYIVFANTYFVASWIDLLFLTSIFLQTVGTLLLLEFGKNIKKKAV